MSTCSGFLLESGNERNYLFIPFFCNFHYASLVFFSKAFRTLHCICMYYKTTGYCYYDFLLKLSHTLFIFVYVSSALDSRQKRNLGEFVHCVMVMLGPIFYLKRTPISVRLRFFDQVGHQTSNASVGNKYFFTK